MYSYYYSPPPITPNEMEDIKRFINDYRGDIIENEIIILDKLITLYQKTQTLENRKQLKTFLIYLRRSIFPSPPNSPTKFREDPERMAFDQSLDPYQLQEDYIYSKSKLNAKEKKREIIYECTCKSCRISPSTPKTPKTTKMPKSNNYNSPSAKFKRTLSMLKKIVVRTK
uniref:Uncharacterized protein n=1 Tax=Panagrolaimus sp. PS1159 TaxID=55785 RepID=A0AC35GPJ1_9BILA